MKKNWSEQISCRIERTGNALSVPAGTFPVYRKIHLLHQYKNDLVKMDSTRADSPESDEDKEVLEVIDFWFSPGVGLLKIEYNVPGKRKLTYTLNEYKMAAGETDNYFPIAEESSWQYVCQELTGNGYNNRYTLKVVERAGGTGYLTVHSMVGGKANSRINAAPPRGTKVVEVGSIKTADGKRYLCYNRTSGEYCDLSFLLPVPKEKIRGGKLFVRYTNMDIVRRWTRVFVFRINGKPESPGDTLAAARVAFIQSFGFTAMFGETMETGLDLARFPYISEQAETGYTYQNLIPVLQDGENRISAYVGSGECSPVTLRMVLYAVE